MYVLDHLNPSFSIIYKRGGGGGGGGGYILHRHVFLMQKIV